MGTTFKYKEIHIVDEHGRRCKQGEEGELIIRGKSVGMGYLNETGGIDKFPDEGIPTGDLGYMDEEGYLFITGRKKDLIIRGGVNISPMEITERLLAHPGVEEAVTIGIPDKIYGEEIACLIVPKSGAKIDEKDIMAHCQETLADFKLPKVIRFLKAIPKTERGKVAKPVLFEMIDQDEGGRAPCVEC